MSKILKPSNVNINVSETISIDNYSFFGRKTGENNLEESIKRNEEIRLANEQAERIISRARKQAEEQSKEIIQDALGKLEEKRKEIYQKSHEEGYEAGLKAAQEEINIKKHELDEKIKENLEIRDNTLIKLEKEIVEFIIDLSQKVLTKSFEIKPDIIRFLVRKGLTQVKNFENLKIYVSEQQYEFVEQNKNDILGIDTENYKIKIIKDTTLENSECLIETDFGTINCSFMEQFESIKNTISLMLN